MTFDDGHDSGLFTWDYLRTLDAEGIGVPRELDGNLAHLLMLNDVRIRFAFGVESLGGRLVPEAHLRRLSAAPSGQRSSNACERGAGASAEAKSAPPKPDFSPKHVLSIDIGGTKIKVLVSGQVEPRKMRSGKRLTPARMVEAVKALARDWEYEAVSIGYPGLVGPSGPQSEPANLAPGWVGFDFAAAFGMPVRVVNDAAMQALGLGADFLEILIVQQVNLMSGGQPVKMSKRAGEFVTLRELMDEVGADCAKFFFLLRSTGAHLDFDLDLARSQNDENPAYYVQYAHARIAALLRFAAERGLEPAAEPRVRLEAPEEIALVRQLATFPEVVRGAAAARELGAQLEDARADVEKQMDLLRHFKHAHTLRLIAQDLAGLLPLETLSDHLSDLASVILAQVLGVVWKTGRSPHRAEPRFAVIGYGKLGGKELGYASDLDLVFLYDDAAPEAPESYARLAQRINHWLTTTTSAGTLYETDLRLRPEGAGGLLVSPLESFREYQRRHAWTWEHQALTRARFIAGDGEIGREFERLREDILRQPRDGGALRKEIVAMRQKILDSHPNPTRLFDLKHDRGGIIDVEFIVQYLVLGHASRHTELTGNIGNLALLKLAAALGLIDSGRALAAHAAYRSFRQRQHSLRLQGERYARVPRAEVESSIQAVLELWDEVIARVANAIK